MTASSLASLSGHGVAHTAHALVAIRWRGCAATSKAKRLGVSPSAPRASLESAAPSAPTAPNLSNGADDEHARMSVAAVDMRLLALPTEGGDPQAADARSARASAARSANSLGAHTRAGELPTLDHWFDTVALPDHPMASQQPSTDAHLARVVHSAHLAVAVLRREKLDVLNSCDVFVGPQARAWPPRVLDAIADESELVPIERYKPVYRFGSPAECVFIIADGAVAVHPLLAKPHALRAGALFGESALLSALSRAQPAHSVSKADAERLPVHWRPDTVECIESGRALRVPAHALRKVPVRRLSLTGELETAARALASVAVARWRASMVQSLSLFHGATQRVAAATADLFQVRLLRSGEYVFSKGQAGTLFFLIVAGAIAIEVPLEDGSIRHVRLIRHTDTSPFFGELALFSVSAARAAARRRAPRTRRAAQSHHPRAARTSRVPHHDTLSPASRALRPPAHLSRRFSFRWALSHSTALCFSTRRSPSTSASSDGWCTARRRCPARTLPRRRAAARSGAVRTLSLIHI